MTSTSLETSVLTNLWRECDGFSMPLSWTLALPFHQNPTKVPHLQISEQLLSCWISMHNLFISSLQPVFCSFDKSRPLVHLKKHMDLYQQLMRPVLTLNPEQEGGKDKACLLQAPQPPCIPVCPFLVSKFRKILPFKIHGDTDFNCEITGS